MNASVFVGGLFCFGGCIRVGFRKSEVVGHLVYDNQDHWEEDIFEVHDIFYRYSLFTFDR